MRAASFRLSPLVMSALVVFGCSSSSTETPAPSDSGPGDTSVKTDTGGTDAKSDGPTDTGKTDTRPDTGPGPCDPLAQTGCTAPATKCTAVDDGAGSGKAGCVTPSGTKAVGDACTRTSQDPSGIGNDDCAAGLFCSGIGSLQSPPSRHCRKFCKDDGKCASTEKCSQLVFEGTTATAGICVPTCTVFGTDCTGSLNCSVLITSMDGTTAHGTCRAVGTKVAGDTCTMAYECAKDMVCADPTKSGKATCIPLCDSSHACSTGSCKPVGSLPSGGGICQ